MDVDWELSQSFTFDSAGVRCCCVVPAVENSGEAYRIITGSQSGSLCEFAVPSGKVNPLTDGDGYAVTALLSLDSSTLVTGSKDSKIRIYEWNKDSGDSSSVTLVGTLEGHEKPVTSLAWCFPDDAPLLLLSGSWDGTAKVWNLKRRCLVATLPGHENSVCVASIRSSSKEICVTTGSAGVSQNNTISGYAVRIWTVDIRTSQTQLVASVENDHSGPIRDIACSKNVIATCSNDGSVKLRDSGMGQAFQTLVVSHNDTHPPMLLSLTDLASPNENFLVASAEDGNVAIWNLQNEDQQHPVVILHATCVWKVHAMPNGDFATAGDDGVVRIFTRATERMAPPEERQKFSEEVTNAMQKKSSGPSTEEVARLPHWHDSYSMRGSSEGQVQVFQKDGIAIAAQWSAASGTWIEVGQVMGSSGDNSTIDGVQYDHVFPIEVDQTGGGVASLQLGYNNGENVFVAAQRFIDDHVLPQHHLQEIANYIEQRLGNAANRHLTSAPAATPSAAPVPAAPPSYQYLPIKGYKSFDITKKTPVDKMKASLQGGGELKQHELETIDTLLQTLAASNRYHSSKVSEDALALLANLLEKWVPGEAFVLLDVARFAAVHPDATTSTNTAKYWLRMIRSAIRWCDEASNIAAVPLLALRLFTNVFRGGPGSRQAVVAEIDSVLACAKKFVSSDSKPVRLAVATLLHNVCFAWHQGSLTQQTQVALIKEMVESVLSNPSYETEALQRSLVGLGTLCLATSLPGDTSSLKFLVEKLSGKGDVLMGTASEVKRLL